METSWWSYAVQSYGGIQQMIGFRPGLRVVGAEDVEIGFEFLIGLFSLSVGLRVVGGEEFDVIFQEMGEFPCEY